MDIVPSAHDQSMINFLKVAHLRFDALRRAENSVVVGSRWRKWARIDGDDGRIGFREMIAFLTAARIVQTRAEYRGGIKIDNQHILFKLLRARDQHSLFVEDHTVAIKDQFILAADHVEIGDDSPLSAARVAIISSRTVLLPV